MTVEIKMLRDRVERMVEEMRGMARVTPEVGNFESVYAEFKITDTSRDITDTSQERTDRGMCLTDVMLRLESLPKHLENHETMRWLSVVGYKLPVPYKSTVVIRRGNKEDILCYLDSQDIIIKILEVIPRLDFNLQDV